MLNFLFDGHTQCYVHPPELKIGYPKKQIWPIIKRTDSPKIWWEKLNERNDIYKYKRYGYTKYSNVAKVKESIEFDFNLMIQKKMFLEIVSNTKTNRQVFDAYMESYFRCWLNYDKTDHTKKYVVGFCTNMNSFRKSA